MEICFEPFTYFGETTKSFAIVFGAFRINRTALAAIQISSAQTVDSKRQFQVLLPFFIKFGESFVKRRGKCSKKSKVN